jgi:hypothetical protein
MAMGLRSLAARPRSNETNDRRIICHKADTPFADLLLPRNSAFPVKAAVFWRPGLVGHARVGCSSLGKPATGAAAVQYGFDVTPVPASFGEAPGSWHPQARSSEPLTLNRPRPLVTTRGERLAADKPARGRRLVRPREHDFDHRLLFCHYVDRFDRISPTSGFSCSICVKAIQCLRISGLRRLAAQHG